MKLEVYALSNIGLKRTTNQDNYYCNGIIPNINDASYRYSKTVGLDKPSLFAVFDGMGGHVHGERASQIAVEEADKAFRIYQEGEPKPLLDSICTSANNRICDEIIHVVKGRMGSTAAMMLFEKEQYHLCNLGDSPIFLIRDNSISTISYEHSERQNYEEIFGKNYDPKKKFKLTQHLGIFPDELELSPYYSYGTLREGDVFILCSDGLTDMVSDQEILRILSQNNSVKATTEELLSIALQNGGKDNITIIACKVLQSTTTRKTIGESIPAKQFVESNTKKKSAKIVSIIIACVVFAAIAVVMVVLFTGNNQTKNDTKPTVVASTEATEIETQNHRVSTSDEESPSSTPASELATIMEGNEENTDSSIDNETFNDLH